MNLWKLVILSLVHLSSHLDSILDRFNRPRVLLFEAVPLSSMLSVYRTASEVGTEGAAMVSEPVVEGEVFPIAELEADVAGPIEVKSSSSGPCKEPLVRYSEPVKHGCTGIIVSGVICE